MKKILILLICLFVSQTAHAGRAVFKNYALGTVLAAKSSDFQDKVLVETLEIMIESGVFKNKLVTTENYLWNAHAYNTDLAPGDSVVVKLVSSGGGLKVYIMSYYRSLYLYAAIILFCILFLSVAGKNKMGALLSIAINIVVVALMLRYIINGYDPFIISIIFCPIAAALSVFLILGFGKKFLVAFSATVIGVVLAGLLTEFFMDMMYIDGRFSLDARFLQLVSRSLPGWSLSDFRGLAAAAVMISCLGAIMDIAVSVASSLMEISKTTRKVNYKILWDSGMNVGRDIIGTMLNSLMLVFLASFLPLIAVFSLLNIPFIKVINFEFVAIVLISAITANLALILSVPVSVFIGSMVYKKQ